MQAVIRTDDIGFLSEWSPEAEKIFSFRDGEVTGWYLGIFIHSIEKMPDEKRKQLGLENILEEVVEKGKKISFSTINIRGDLRAFQNTIEIEPDGEGTKATITKGEDTQEIIDYNTMIDKLDHRPIAVTSNKGRILGINGKFALMAKVNRMRLLNRPLGLAEDAEKIALGDIFETLDAILMVWSEQK
ncbi:MAG TPA: hypothetical protein PK718_03090 [Candidatus Methanofastidiosa archaeon]|nr:hypothetical protein [Candidatus Methanofastidiosa archaeon]HPR41515.1 hypothetical protein [Candidatus Methanofastidiosa archaeon]